MKQSILAVIRPSWTTNRRLRGILMSLIMGSAPVSTVYAVNAVTRNFSGKITLQDGQLAAHIEGIPLRQVMAEVSRLSGAQVRWLSPDGEELVSAKFTALPLAEALRRILGEKNFLLFYSSARAGTRLAQIWISSGREGERQAALVLQSVSSLQKTPPDSDAASQVVIDPDTLIQTALHDQDPYVRLDAITQLGGYAQEDARVQTILAQVAHNDSSLQVQQAAAELLRDLE